MKQYLNITEVWGFHSDENFLGYGIVQPDRGSPTYLRNLLPCGKFPWSVGNHLRDYSTSCHKRPQQTLKHDQHHYMTAIIGAKNQTNQRAIETFSKSQFQLKNPNHKLPLENWFLLYVIVQFKRWIDRSSVLVPRISQYWQHVQFQDDLP